MTKCDLCMTEIRSGRATLLQEKWQIDDVKEVCKDCADEITLVSIALDNKIRRVRDGIRKRLVPRLYERLRGRRETPQ